MQSQLKEAIIPLYSEALQAFDASEVIWPFSVQIGDEYDAQDFKILFVGKSINGGSTTSRNIEELFGGSERSIFGRQNPLEWFVDEKREKGKYNSKRSAFWRIIRKIVVEKLEQENWHNRIAWSNLYKFSPGQGNPDEKLKKKQLAICRQIIEAEIDFLKPNAVIFLTSGWETDFIDAREENHKGHYFKTVEWKSGRKDYTTKGWKSDNCIYITTFHPERKNTDNHKGAILEIINYLESNNT